MGLRRQPSAPVDVAGADRDAAFPPQPPHERARSAPRPFDEPGRLPGWAVPLVLTALLAIPFVVALVVLRHPRWYPLGDLAQTELRVRAVASRHPPLIGLPGRLGMLGNQGSHPGPMSFWLLWPFYQLFGAHSWGLFAASASLHVAAIATALWIAYRRGGTTLAVGVALLLAVLTRGYGAELLTQAWNPYMPVLAWIVVLLALWSVVVDDLLLFPVAVFAASFCMQTHLPYLGLCGGLVACTAVFVLARALRRRREEPDAFRRAVRWTGVAAAVGVVVWIPPLVDELTHSTGNLTVVWRELTNPPEPPIGTRAGVSWVLVRLNPWHVLTRGTLTTSSTASIVPGVIVLVLWAVAVVLAVRARHRALVGLHAVVAAALLFAAISLVRVHGFPWYYLTLWGYGLCLLLVLAVIWTFAVAFSSRAGGITPYARTGAINGVLVMLVVLCVVVFSVEAGSAAAPLPRYSKTLGRLAPKVIDALDRGTVRGGGRNGRYLVSWTDPIAIGTMGYGLLDELSRNHFDIGALSIHRGGVPPPPILDPKHATAVVHLSVGPDIEVWRAKAGVFEVSYYDPRSPAQRTEYERLRTRVKDDLRAIGREDLVPNVDGNTFTSSLDQRVPAADRGMLGRMVGLGLPAAVFVGPPEAQT